MPPSYYPGASQDPFAALVGEGLGGFQQGRDMARQNRLDLEAREAQLMEMQRRAERDKIFKEEKGYRAPTPTGAPAGVPGTEAPAAETGAGGPPVPEDAEMAPDAMQGALASQGAAPAAPGGAQAMSPGQAPQSAERGIVGRVKELGGRVGRGLKERLSTFNSGGFQPFEPGPMPVKTGPSMEERGWEAQAGVASADRASRESMNTQDNETALEVARMQREAEYARIQMQMTEQEFNEVYRAIQQYGAMTDAARLQYELGDEMEAESLAAQSESIRQWITGALQIQPSAQELTDVFKRYGSDDTVLNEPPAPRPTAPRPIAPRVGEALRGRGGGTSW